tara:strand:- start:10369 stop:10635 length:267 start_codon:yes stop_codon:yes gene_type:complete
MKNTKPKKLNIAWIDFINELKKGSRWAWLQKATKEEKKYISWLVKNGTNELTPIQKINILNIYQKQILLNNMYGDGITFKSIFKGLFK